MAVLLGILLALTCGVAATLNMSLRNLSFARLTKVLAARGRVEQTEIYREKHDDFIRGTAVVRMISTLALILLVIHPYLEETEVHPLLFYGEVFLICGAVIFLCGVAIPQPCAKYLGEPLLARALPLLRVIDLLIRPTIGVIMRLLDSLVRRLAGVPKSDGQTEAEQIEQEVLDAVDEAELHGAVDKEERDMIQSVMQLDEYTAGDIMTPRTEVVAIQRDTTLQDIKDLIKKEGHSRIPVYGESIDHVLGMIYAKDLLHVKDDQDFNLMDLIREVPFVPETKLLSELLKEFRTGKTHVAMVLDEYGGTAGLVTIEDILEELVGEIVDEYEPPEPQPIQQVSKNVVDVDSKVHVDEINTLLQMDIPESDDYETIGGFVFSALGKIPLAGEQFVHHNARITILEAEDRKIKRLRIETLPLQAGL